MDGSLTVQGLVKVSTLKVLVVNILQVVQCGVLMKPLVRSLVILEKLAQLNSLCCTWHYPKSFDMEVESLASPQVFLKLVEDLVLCSLQTDFPQGLSELLVQLA